MIDLTTIIEIVITLIVTVLAAFALPWFKRNTSAKEREDLLCWVDIAVAAAQQLYHHLSGEQRLQHALELLQEKGFNIDSAAVRDAVEAAVLKLHQQLKEVSDDC